MVKTVPLEPGKYYHVYNRGNNREDLFVEERNYAYFLKLYAFHVAPIADTFAYCLMRNHFHLLLRVRSELTGLDDPSGLASRRFSDLFNAYAKAINKAHGRTGALFERPFGRIDVATDAYLARLVVYIHRNPQKHHFVADFRDWPHSSYHSLLAAQVTRLKRDQVFDWFGGAQSLIAAHEHGISDPQVLELVPDDFDWVVALAPDLTGLEDPSGLDSPAGHAQAVLAQPAPTAI